MGNHDPGAKTARAISTVSDVAAGASSTLPTPCQRPHETPLCFWRQILLSDSALSRCSHLLHRVCRPGPLPCSPEPHSNQPGPLQRACFDLQSCTQQLDITAKQAKMRDAHLIEAATTINIEANKPSNHQIIIAGTSPPTEHVDPQPPRPSDADPTSAILRPAATASAVYLLHFCH